MGFGTEILFMLVLGALLLGPKQLHEMLGHVARARAQFEKIRRSLKPQLEEELDATRRSAANRCSAEVSRNQ